MDSSKCARPADFPRGSRMTLDFPRSSRMKPTHMGTSEKGEIKLSVTRHWNAISHAIICDRNIDVISDNVGMATKEQNLSIGGP